MTHRGRESTQVRAGGSGPDRALDPKPTSLGPISLSWSRVADSLTVNGTALLRPGRAWAVISSLPIRPELLRAAIIVLVASVAFVPIVLKGFPQGADIEHHYRWTFYFFQALKRGYLYPRWISEVNHGYGSPAGIYYPPLSLYVSSFFKAILGDTLNSISVACWAATVISGFAMYRFSRLLLSERLSLLASALYVLSTYHTFDLYRGNAVAELWCFAWVPLIFDAVYRIAHSEDRGPVLYLGFSYALLLLSDVPVSFLVTLIIPVFAVVLTRRRAALLRTLAGLGLGFGLSAFFFISVVFERGYVKPNPLLAQGYEDTFLFERLRQVMSINLLSHAEYPKRHGYLLEAELAAAALLVLWGLGSLIVCWVGRIESVSRRRLILAVLGISAVSIIMTSRASLFIWKTVPELKYLQVTNRWLVAATFGACVLASTAISCVAGAARKAVLTGLLLAPAIILNLAVSVHISTQQPLNRTLLPAALAGAGYIEFFPPKWSFERQDSEFDASAYSVSSGQCSIVPIDDRGLEQSFSVSAAADSTVRFRPLFFPGWTARIDGRTVRVRPGAGGHVELLIPSGTHHIQLRFGDTWVRSLGKVISGLTLVLFVTLGVIDRRRKRTEQPGQEVSDRPLGQRRR